jgi:hypothetical protein
MSQRLGQVIASSSQGDVEPRQTVIPETAHHRSSAEHLPGDLRGLLAACRESRSDPIADLSCGIYAVRRGQVQIIQGQ